MQPCSSTITTARLSCYFFACASADLLATTPKSLTNPVNPMFTPLAWLSTVPPRFSATTLTGVALMFTPFA